MTSAGGRCSKAAGTVRAHSVANIIGGEHTMTDAKTKQSGTTTSDNGSKTTEALHDATESGARTGSSSMPGAMDSSSERGPTKAKTERNKP